MCLFCFRNSDSKTREKKTSAQNKTSRRHLYFLPFLFLAQVVHALLTSLCETSPQRCGLLAALCFHLFLHVVLHLTLFRQQLFHLLRCEVSILSKSVLQEMTRMSLDTGRETRLVLQSTCPLTSPGIQSEGQDVNSAAVRIVINADNEVNSG